MKKLVATAALIALASPSIAQDEPEAAPSPNQIVEQASEDEWVSIAPENLLIMRLADDADGESRVVMIQLMPPPFSQGWIDNIRTLARSGWYDGTAIIRVQDNYVTQWGDPQAGEDGAKPLPEGLKVVEEDAYASDTPLRDIDRGSKMPGGDNYAERVGFADGFPVGYRIYSPPMGAKLDEFLTNAWPTHCYGMIGVARGMSPATGDGSSLYTVIGHAPRHLDRNIAVVGRVIEGMEHLSSLPRGSGPLGFYAEGEEGKRTPIQSVRVASDLPEEERPLFEYLSTESESFARYAEARANRRDPFFIQPAGGADICNIPVPVRPTPNG